MADHNYFSNLIWQIADQMFTMAHELAHVWLGPEGEGISGFEGLFPGNSRVEKFCDQAVDEFLVSAMELREYWRDIGSAPDSFERVARHFTVRAALIAATVSGQIDVEAAV